MSGDLAKIFRHEDPKAPGVFAAGAPSAAATLLAREVIQNSWDAARELREGGPAAPQFEIEFRFKELHGADKRAIVNALDLRSFAIRAASIDRRKVGLPPRDCLSELDTDEPLRVLQITEYGTTGMYGPWQENKSHMFLALLSIGFTEKAPGAGGSYGYGKAGLISGSRIRSVVAYTCFRPDQREPDVTRRLLGVTYWGPHDYQGINHPGIATFSSGSAGDIQPFVNKEADAIASALGLAIRSPARLSDLGTTFLLIDTPIKPEDLVRAVERSWWPALVENDLVVAIVDFDGSPLAPRPMRDPVLRTFIAAWEIAVGRSMPGSDSYRSDLTAPPAQRGLASAGRLGLIADLTGWSYATDEIGPNGEEILHRSLVALTRGPKMVVEYLEAGHTPPYVRGAFIADPAIDDRLRETEPKAHDAWRTKAEEGEVSPEAAAIATHVIKKIKQTVNNFRTKLKPPTPPPEDFNLPLFDKVMRKIMAGAAQGKRQPVAETRPIAIRLDYAPVQAARDRVKIRGRVAYSLSEHFSGDRANVTVQITYRFVEDDRVGDHVPLSIKPPDGFISDGTGRYAGLLVRGTEARFTFESEPYDPSWSGRLVVHGELSDRVRTDGDTE